MTKVLLSHPPRPASHNSNRAMVWVRKNLFSSWSNSLLTIGCIWLMWELIPRTIWSVYVWALPTRPTLAN